MTEKTKPTRADFLMSFPWPKADIRRIGDQLYIPLSDDRLALIELTECNGFSIATAGTYVGFRVEILSTHRGEIAWKAFPWADHLEIDPKTRNENAMVKGLCVIDHCGWEWYIAWPKETRPIVEAISRYINLFDPEWLHRRKS